MNNHLQSGDYQLIPPPLLFTYIFIDQRRIIQFKEPLVHGLSINQNHTWDIYLIALLMNRNPIFLFPKKAKLIITAIIFLHQDGKYLCPYFAKQYANIY